MAEQPIVFLMYHELELPHRALCQSEAGYLRYILSVSDFKTQMLALKSEGWRGLNVSTALTFPAGQNVAITFDDGCETDLLAAAPVLQELGFGATFYVSTGFMGRPGYVSPAQLRELAELRFEIGCHSMTHPYLTELGDADLRREIFEAKLQLEQILGSPVKHFSCPSGRYNQRVVQAVRDAGYGSMATSRIHANTPGTDRFGLGRVAIRRGINSATFASIYTGRGLWKLSVGDKAGSAAKRLLGNAAYDRLRARLLSRDTR